jgi:hypothetical protein
MRGVRVGLGAVLVLAVAASAAGQDAVTLKVARPKDGDRVKVTKSEKTKSTTTFAAGGKTQAKDDVLTRTVVYVDEVVTADPKGGKPTKLRRTYEKYDVTKGGKADAGPPLNTPILIEKKGDKYEFTADKPLDPGFAAALSADFNRPGGSSRDEDLLPDNPVRPGDTWKVDGKKIVAAIGSDGGLVIDEQASSLTGRLVKTYRKDGKLFGVMEYAGEIVIKSLGEKASLRVKAGSKMGMKLTREACVDGTDPSATTVGDLSARIEAEGMGLMLTLAADGKTTNTEELLPKK